MVTVLGLFLLRTSSFQEIFAGAALCVAALFSVVCILGSQQAIHLRRERRAWLVVLISLLFALVGQLLCTTVPGGRLSPMFGVLANTGSYLALWVACYLRSGKAPQDAPSRCVLAVDLLLILCSCLAFFGWLSRSLSVSGRSIAANGSLALLYAVLGMLTLMVLSCMLYRALPRPLHGPRTLLVGGGILWIMAQWGTTFRVLHGDAAFAGVWCVLGMLGLTSYGIAALWEASFYQQRSARLRVIDPFPAAAALWIPVLLVLGMLAVSAWSAGHGATTFLRVGQWYVLLIMVLFVIRHLLTFAHHQRLYRHLQGRFADMAESAATDPLTNLANHRFFMARLIKEMRRATRYQRPVALIFCDLDHFKGINDTYGHIAGDHVLQVMAECLQGGVRELDMVARYGGEEFVILLPETTMVHAALLAERLRIAVEQLRVPLRQDEVTRLTMSCGISAYPETCDSVESLLASADNAMYQAKRTGRNRVVSAPTCPTAPAIRPTKGDPAPSL
jgi:diguanylate cyclase (GGDEF)-like protein